MALNALKLARMERGLTQLDLAKRLGTSEKMVSCWETGRAEPTIEQAVDIGRILGVEPGLIFPDMFDRAVIKYQVDKKLAEMKLSTSNSATQS